ncbi:dimethylamine monooxygenase subunit DmmA family protein [Bacillus songklensis]|uniref:Dimethylamine monooxygenase subunit DmmA family protein n=1 Tax=Bacillus songklensis TaxID=1069116 RepID=A0ABV8B2G3_9BACI
MNKEGLNQESNLIQKATFISGKRKYLFCADQKGMSILTPIIERVIEEKLSFELLFMGENHEKELPPADLSKWLSQQKMGSYLYLAGPWNMLKSIKRLAEEIGFSDEEAQFVGYGVQQMNVFCCRCHGITEMEIQETSQQEKKIKPEIMCRHCDLLLVVSDHYSSLRDAYLGYVAKL